MNKKLFLFFGCSWTYGKNINLSLTQKKTEYSVSQELEQANLYAYRSLISAHFGADQRLFAEGGSSNQRQFRYAAQHFLSRNHVKLNQAKLYAHSYTKVRDQTWPSVEEFISTGSLPTHIVDEIVNQHNLGDFIIFKTDDRPKYVFWFITSTARIEFFDASKQNHVNEFLTYPRHEVGKTLAVNCYDHKQELEKLAYQMTLWNAYFETQGIKNIWIDTFNHHEYPINIKNYIKLGSQAADIMSSMCTKLGYHDFENSEYHYSVHEADDTRAKFLVDQGVLNAQTLHPTVAGHRLIADILIPKIQQHFVNLTDN
jgi:hypothetical protein